MKGFIKIVLFLLLTGLNGVAVSQADNGLYNTFKPLSDSDSGKLWLCFENENFIRNNEYFNNLTDGITIIGATMMPNLKYQFSPSVSFQAGVFLTKFSGKDEIYRHDLWLRCNYQINKNINLVIGNLYGSLQHNLAEPLYSTDRHYLKPPETGIQFLVKSRYFENDYWLNWEKFILPGSPFKEEFVMGTSGKIRFADKEKISLNMPFQGLATHKGGQNETNTEPLQTLFNTASGIDVTYKYGKENRSLNLTGYFMTYNDASGKSVMLFPQGYGFLGSLSATCGKFFISGGYWYGYRFISRTGEPLFQSVSQKYSSYSEPEKRLILNKIQFHHKIKKGIDFAVRFEYYYDVLQNNNDFSYSMLLMIREDFFLKKIINRTERD